jgi:hypothetical protein
MTKRITRAKLSSGKTKDRDEANIKEKISIFARLNDSNHVHVSDFCVTDNDKYMIFYYPDNFIVDNGLIKHENEFPLNENNFTAEFDKNIQLEIETQGNGETKFDKVSSKIDSGESTHTLGYVNSELVSWFVSNYPKCVFHAIDRLFDQQVNTLIIILDKAFGKPVGILKAINN